MNERITSKEFESWEDAAIFSANVGGYIEGPFLDDKLNRSYIVFYREV